MAMSVTLDQVIEDLIDQLARPNEPLSETEERIRNILDDARTVYRRAGALYGDTDAGFIWWIALREVSNTP